MRICFPTTAGPVPQNSTGTPRRGPILPSVRGWYLPIPEILVIIAGFPVQRVYPTPYTSGHIGGEVAVTIGFLRRECRRFDRDAGTGTH